MVKQNLQTEILLELVFSSSSETNEQQILKKSIPLYLRKLNCFIASALKKNEGNFEEILLVPFISKKSDDWIKVKTHFSNLPIVAHNPCSQLTTKNAIYYAYNLKSYGILILGRKKPFSLNLINELKPVINHLGKDLEQANETEQRKKVEASLRESEQCLRTLSETTAASIFIYHQKKIIYANHASEIFSGYSLNELLNLNVSDLIHPDYLQLVHDVNPTRSEAKNTNARIELKVIKKNGEQRWIDVNVGIIKWMGYNAAIISSFDITQRKQAENNLISAKEDAEKSERLKTAFLANMSHEIRTPMNGILGFAELLKRPNLSGEKQQLYIDIIEKSGERMLNLINDIIDISKIEAHLMKVSNTEININNQIEYIFNFFKLEANNKKLEISLYKALPFEEAFVKTDKEKLYAILLNLVKNAVKYTVKGTIELGYYLKTDKEQTYIEYFVKDTGIGVPKNRRKAIFERFIQADIDDKKAIQGAGLGLSISKAYTKMLGGNIWVEDNNNNGSIFYFTIPYTR